MANFPKVPHPLPTDPTPKAEVKPLISPDVIASMRPASDEPRYGGINGDTLIVMHVPSVGYIVMRTHEREAGVSIFTESEVTNYVR